MESTDRVGHPQKSISLQAEASAPVLNRREKNGGKEELFFHFLSGELLREFPKNNDFPVFPGQEDLVPFLLFIKL